MTIIIFKPPFSLHGKIFVKFIPVACETNAAFTSHNVQGFLQQMLQGEHYHYQKIV